MIATDQAKATAFPPLPKMVQPWLAAPFQGCGFAKSGAVQVRQGGAAQGLPAVSGIVEHDDGRPTSHRRPAKRLNKRPVAGPAVTSDGDTQSDRDLTITLLSRCLSLKEAAEATDAIFARYGSYADAVAAPLHELSAIPALGETAATLLKCIHSSVVRLTSIPLRQTPVLKDWPTLSAYLNVCVGRERIESCHVLFLNAKNHLISDHLISEGDARSVQVPVRTITKRALELEATALILVHNHPSGDPTPSDEDIVMTERVKHAVSIFGIVVHDHIIVGRSECFSVRTRSYMKSYSLTEA